MEAVYLVSMDSNIDSDGSSLDILSCIRSLEING